MHALCTPLKLRFRPEYNRSIPPVQTELEETRRHHGLSPCRRPHSAFHVLVVKSPHMRSEEIRFHLTTVNYQSNTKVTELTRLRSSAPMRSLLPRWRPWFSRYLTFSRSQLIIYPDAIPLTAFRTPNGLNE